jgi:hypothetical protein
VHDRRGSNDVVWRLAVVLGLMAALMHWLMTRLDIDGSDPFFGMFGDRAAGGSFKFDYHTAARLAVCPLVAGGCG